MGSKKSNNLGEQTAKKINWAHKIYSSGDVSLQSAHGFCISSWCDYLVNAIGNAETLSDKSFEMCKTCQKKHIKWEPSVSMYERDMCLSKLPIRFVAKEFEGAWNAFAQVIDKVVRFEEIRQGRLLDPNRKAWDKSYHEGSDEWTSPGRMCDGCWWKWRNEDAENETEVPPKERNCRLCNRAKNGEELAPEASTWCDIEEEARNHA